MDRNGIVETLGRQRRVEHFVQYYARQAGIPADDQKDLSQIVYLALLRTNEEKLRDLWEHDEINFYIGRIIRTQIYGNRTDFDRDVRAFRSRSVPIETDDGI